MPSFDQKDLLNNHHMQDTSSVASLSQPSKPFTSRGTGHTEAEVGSRAQSGKKEKCLNSQEGESPGQASSPHRHSDGGCRRLAGWVLGKPGSRALEIKQTGYSFQRQCVNPQLKIQLFFKWASHLSLCRHEQ